MFFTSPLQPGRLINRYKRFFADVLLDDGEIVTAHCANPGSMMGLSAPGSRVWVQPKDSGTLKYSLELVETDLGGGMRYVGVNTGHANGLVDEAIENGRIPPLAGYAFRKREVKYGLKSRIDLLLDDAVKGRCFVEIKTVSLMRQRDLAEFPDSVTLRGATHLVELANKIRTGHRAVMFYLIQTQAKAFDLAGDIDPAYAAAFAKAKAAGVEAYAWSCYVSPDVIMLENQVPVLC